MQPTYLPWLGYFELMARSDAFVFLDDVQFAKKSWQQRNCIKSVTGELLLAVPVKTSGARFQKINEVLIDNHQDWKRKHLKSIQLSYAKAPFFEQHFGALRETYDFQYTQLADLNVALIKLLANIFGIATPTLMSSSLPAAEERNEKILDICRQLGANRLYDAQGARAVLDLPRFEEAGIAVEFQDYKHPVYSQQHGQFLPCLSALDLLFNEGEKSLDIILSGISRDI